MKLAVTALAVSSAWPGVVPWALIETMLFVTLRAFTRFCTTDSGRGSLIARMALRITWSLSAMTTSVEMSLTEGEKATSAVLETSGGLSCA